MSPKPNFMRAPMRSLLAVLCASLLVPGYGLANAAPPQQTKAPEHAPLIPHDQLDSLVAPIALFPDPLLAQVLAASTYPLELVQLQQWLQKNPGLKDKALADAAEKEPWDASVQALAGLPDLVKRLTDDIRWTTDLGNAFLGQESDVMDAVQRMRMKAKEKGNLSTSEQQTVETQVVQNKTVVVIEPANPEVLYVPSYNPAVVYGPPAYPYPPIYYPPAGYYAAGMALSFGVGVAMGAWWGGGSGWGAGWGGNNVIINNNNNFIRNSNISRGSIGSGNNWQHNPAHRGSTPYRDRATADRFGGAARGDSLGNRQNRARQDIGRQGGNLPSNRGGGAGNANRLGGGAGNRGGASAGTLPANGRGGAGRGVGDANRLGGGAGAGNRGGVGTNNRPAAGTGAAGRSGGAGSANRMGGGAGAVNRSPGAGSANRMGGNPGGANRMGGGGFNRSAGRPSHGGGGGGHRGGGGGGRRR
jgi:Protein of unknown function (DUF3300)